MSTQLSLDNEERQIDQMLDQCWASVADDGPTLIQHLIYVSCNIRCMSRILWTARNMKSHWIAIHLEVNDCPPDKFNGDPTYYTMLVVISSLILWSLPD